MKWFNHIAIAAATTAVLQPPLVPIAILGATAPDWLERIHRLSTGQALRHRGPTHYVVMWIFGVIIGLALFDVHGILTAFCYGGLTHVFADALTVSGVPFSPLSDRRFHLFGGRLRTGNPGEYLVSGIVVIACAVLVTFTRHFGDLGFTPFFFDYAEYYQQGLIDASEWKANRFQFF